MLELWKWYQNCLAVHPVKKQVISSGFIWGFGDIAAKSIPHHTAKKYHQIKVFISIITCHSRKSFFFI
jgi:protein Mpv17